MASVRVGCSHKWYYDQGQWKETKITPDLWQVSYAVTKRRAGRAPEGSGVPVGTAYRWYVLAHQHVEKQNANDYTTSLTGLKFKIAHRRAGSEKWSATPKTQRKRMIQFLQSVIADLEKQNAHEGAVTTEGARATVEQRPTRVRKSATAPAVGVRRRGRRATARRQFSRATGERRRARA